MQRRLLELLCIALALRLGSSEAAAAVAVDMVEVQEQLYRYLFMSAHSASLVTFPNCYRGERARYTSYAAYMAQLRRDNSSALEVALEISLAEVSRVSEREQSIMLKLFSWIEWSDCRLKWSLQQFPIEQISLRLEAANTLTFYTPLISLLREITPHFSHLSETEIKLHHTGRVTVYKEYVTAIGCTLDIHAYPFDTHICDITFEAAESRRVVNITLNSMGFDHDESAVKQISEVHTAAMLKTDAWDVLVPRSFLGERVIPNCLSDNEETDLCSFRQITHRVILRRYPTYQLLNLVVPTAVTMFLSSFVFLTTPDTDKMNLSVTVLFMLTMYVQIMYSKMPETGETALLTQYYLFCIALESFSCLASVISCIITNSVVPMSPRVARVVDLLGPLVVTHYVQHRKLLKHSVRAKKPRASAPAHAQEGAFGPADQELLKFERHLAAALFDRCYFLLHSVLCLVSLSAFLVQGFIVWNNFGYLLTEDEWKYVH